MTTPDDLASRLAELEATVARVNADVLDLAVVVGAANLDAATATSAIYASLDNWFTDYFAVVFTRALGGEIRWCPQWREHPEAITRLEALWRSWETLRVDPNLGMITWLTSYCDPQLSTLMSRQGPFAQCTLTRHVPATPLPVDPE